jgi:hypothetical protein
MQADLRVEAINLQRFYNNFEGLHQTVVWPKLVPDLVRYLLLKIGFYLFDLHRSFSRGNLSCCCQVRSCAKFEFLYRSLKVSLWKPLREELHYTNFCVKGRHSIHRSVKYLEKTSTGKVLGVVGH